MFGCDGEDMYYREKITFNTMKGNIEICFDSDSYFREYEWFTASNSAEDEKV
jgi:hypothetical protein